MNCLSCERAFQQYGITADELVYETRCIILVQLDIARQGARHLVLGLWNRCRPRA